VFLCLSASFLQFAKRPGSIPGNGVFLCLSASFLQFAKRVPFSFCSGDAERQSTCLYTLDLR
jgi:hypothetical protein